MSESTDELRVEVLPDADQLAARAAGEIATALRQAVAAKDRASLALSGGSTPARMLASLAEEDLPWSQIHVFQVDERVAPDGDPDRNLNDLRRTLLRPGVLPPDNLHPMPVTEDDLARAAEAYAAELSAVTAGALDLVHLGLGDDGHTASWPPGDPVVDSPLDVAVVGPYRGHWRMTLTPRVVNRAGRILWLVSGADKAPVLSRLLERDPALPASGVRRSGAAVLADSAAATQLPGSRR